MSNHFFVKTFLKISSLSDTSPCDAFERVGTIANRKDTFNNKKKNCDKVRNDRVRNYFRTKLNLKCQG